MGVADKYEEERLRAWKALPFRERWHRAYRRMLVEFAKFVALAALFSTILYFVKRAFSGE